MAGGTVGLDYYHILRISPQASKKEIDQAHDQLIKEARYDTSIDRRLVENAYRILSDPAHKSIYDLSVSQKANGKKAKPRKGGVLQKLTIKELVRILAVLVVIATVFYLYRYNYLIKRFSVGDTVYMAETNEKLGKIIRKENSHDFGTFSADAYMIRKDSGEALWLPKKNIQIHCYRKKQ